MSTELDLPIRHFAESMQRKLDMNKHKECPKMNPNNKGRSWEKCSLSWLLYRLRQETLELEEALGNVDVDAIINESADIGNFAMMIHDIAKKSS